MVESFSAASRRMWSLPAAFTPPELEARFLQDYGRRFAPHRQVAIWLALLIGVAYLPWDAIVPALQQGRWPRLDGVMLNRCFTALALLPFLLLSLLPRFREEEPFATGCLVAGAYLQFALYGRGYLLAPHPSDDLHYFIGLFICLIYGMTMLRLRVKALLLLGLLDLLTALPVFTLSLERLPIAGSAPPQEIWPALSFLLTACTMGFVVGNLLESSERASFLRANELARYTRAIMLHSDEVQQLNQALRVAGEQARQKSLALIELKERMRQEAERRNQEKSQFLAAAVHDLKQPIQAISNVLEPGRLAMQTRDHAAALRMFDLAAEATQLMREQLAGVLEISRLESGFVQADVRLLDLAPVIRSVLSQLGPAAQRDGVRLDGPDLRHGLLVRSDTHFMSRILHNVIGNGIKYHDPAKAERCVRVLLRPAATQLQVEIVDNGIGIDAQHLQSGAIFKPFFQASHQRCESEKGVGLGLSIVHAMIELLPGHRLELNSVQGQGTRLAITLPWADSASARPAATAEAASLAAAWPAAPADALRGVYVLYVEDDDLVRSATCALFEAYGLLYEAASSLAHLRSLLQDIERRPDLVISDYRLPGGKTAADVAEMVHQSDPDVPMLILTGEGLQDEPRTPHWTTLRKPVAAPHLLATIRRLVQAQAVS